MKRVRNAALGAGLGLAGAYGYRAATYKREASRGFDLSKPPAPGSDEFANLIEALAGSPLRRGNRVEILRNGREIFPPMIEAIKSAQETVDFVTYIYWTGEGIAPFGDALVERAASGIEVNILLDAVGSRAKIDRDVVDRLQEAGARLVWYHPPHWYTLQKFNNRLHRRILVVDGKVGFTGGVGIAEEWTGDAEDPDHWRETHVRVEGPAVRDLVGGIEENWAESTRNILTGSHTPPLEAFTDGIDVQVTRSSPTKGSSDVERLFYAAIVGARERIWLTTAFFVPRQAFTDALCDAVARGVDVRVLTNGDNVDKEVVREAGQLSFGELLQGGVRIFEYQRTMLHAKVLTIDGAWATVGSNNFSSRSFALNSELTFTIRDEGVVSELEKHFFDDLDASREIDLQSWSNRPLAKRLYERAGSLARAEF